MGSEADRVRAIRLGYVVEVNELEKALAIAGAFLCSLRIYFFASAASKSTVKIV
jgi:hypothetical protein